MKKIENIEHYITASEAARILTTTHGRPIRPDYVCKMATSTKHSIRTARKHDHLVLYHRADIEACTIGSGGRAATVRSKRA